MKANSDKSYLLLIMLMSSTANINGDIIKNSESEKLLGVTIDYKLNLEEHLSKVCDKVSQKLIMLLHAFLHKWILIRENVLWAFIISQFGYCPLVWFFCSQKINNCMNRIQECALRIVYKDCFNLCFYGLRRYTSSVRNYLSVRAHDIETHYLIGTEY